MVVATASTTSDGSYQFTEVVVGTYHVEFEIPPGYNAIFSPLNQGTDDTLDSDVNSSGATDLFTLLANELVEHLDAGFVPQS